MKLYAYKNESAQGKKIIADDMILTKDMPTTAGSRMLDGYQSLFDAEVLTRLYAEGYSLAGKAEVGEFSVDLVGESSYNGAIVKDGKLVCAAAQLVSDGEASCAVAMDVNGSIRRAAAQMGLVAVKPTYGTVSRFGTVPVACSGECVSLMAKSADECYDVLKVIVGHDDKDGTSLSDELCKSALEKGKLQRVALIKEMTVGADSEASAKLDAAVKALEANGVEVTVIEAPVIAKARSAWNILMCAELCNNVSRYDGVKYGYRASNFVGIDELYTNSRTEAFGKLLKSAILFGSDTLSTENYMKVYDKALRSRRVITEKFAEIFGEFDAVLMPAVSKMAYTEADVKADEYASFTENFYTAPASVTGLPAVAVAGVQLVGKAFSESKLLDLAKLI